jgi:hypothetical protein
MEHFLNTIENNILAFFGITVAGVSLPAVIIFLFKFYLNRNKINQLNQTQAQSNEINKDMHDKLDLIMDALLIFNANVNLSPGEKSKLRDISNRYNDIKYTLSAEITKATVQAAVINTTKEIVKTQNGKTFIR